MKKKNVKAMGKARKLVAPGSSLKGQVSTICNGNLSLGGHLDLHGNVVKNAIDEFFSGRDLIWIYEEFAMEMNFYHNRIACTDEVTERWIKNLDYIFQKFVLRSNGVTYLEPRLYTMYEDYLAGELGNALVTQLMRQEQTASELLSRDPTPYETAELISPEFSESNKESKVAKEGEGVLCPPLHLRYLSLIERIKHCCAG